MELLEGIVGLPEDAIWKTGAETRVLKMPEVTLKAVAEGKGGVPQGKAVDHTFYAFSDMIVVCKSEGFNTTRRNIFRVAFHLNNTRIVVVSPTSTSPSCFVLSSPDGTAFRFYASDPTQESEIVRLIKSMIKDIQRQKIQARMAPPSGSASSSLSPTQAANPSLLPTSLPNGPLQQSGESVSSSTGAFGMTDKLSGESFGCVPGDFGGFSGSGMFRDDGFDDSDNSSEMTTTETTQIQTVWQLGSPDSTPAKVVPGFLRVKENIPTTAVFGNVETSVIVRRGIIEPRNRYLPAKTIETFTAKPPPPKPKTERPDVAVRRSTTLATLETVPFARTKTRAPIFIALPKNQATVTE